MNADAKASWGKTFDDLIAKADATINGQAKGSSASAPAQANAPPPSAIPVNSAIHATYTASNQQLALAESYLRTPQTNLTMNGTISKRSSLAVRLQANDLREVAAIANLFSTPKPGTLTPQPLDLSGSATVPGQRARLHVRASPHRPALRRQTFTSTEPTGKFSAPTSMPALRPPACATPIWSPQARGRITFNATTGLKKWAFTNTSPIQVELNASQMNVADLTKLAGQQIPVTGTLNTHVTLHGTELNPIGNGTLALTKVTAYDEPVNSVNIDFNGTGDEAHAKLSVDLPAGQPARQRECPSQREDLYRAAHFERHPPQRSRRT